MNKTLIALVMFACPLAPAQGILQPIFNAPPAAAGGPTLRGSCNAANYQPTGGISSCPLSVNPQVNDVVMVFVYTDSTGITTYAANSGGCTITWGTPQTSVVQHFMGITLGTVTGGGACTISFTSTTATANANDIVALDWTTAIATFDPATPGFATGGFGSPTSTSALTTTTNGDIACVVDYSINTSGSFSSLSFSDSTTVTTTPLNGLMSSTAGDTAQGTIGLAYCGIQATATTFHGIFTPTTANGDAVMIASIKQ